MKITFIQPYYENVWEALGLGYIIAYVKKYYGILDDDLEINFFQGKFDSDDYIVSGSCDSDIVAFSCTSPAFDHGLSLARQIKARNCDVHTVFGGWHPTAVPEDVIRRSPVDQVIVGEGELAMVRVMLGNRNPIIKGIKLDPDELPRPDRKAIKNERTIDLCGTMNGKRTASFQMNRGCKVHCKFCSEIIMTGKYNKTSNPIRTRHYDYVLNEIVAATADFGINYFKFVDATFDRDAKTVIDFCQRKIDRGNTMPWEANIHPGFVQSKEVFEWLIKANCRQINVGVESGSPYILRDVGKGTSISQIENVFKWAREYGIQRRAYFLLGMPEEDIADLERTTELIDKIKPDVVGFTILAPYPGSDFYEPSLHKDVDWSKVDEYTNDIWSTKNFTNEQLKNVQARFKMMYNYLLCERQGDMV